jgi:hypothetical protein
MLEQLQASLQRAARFSQELQGQQKPLAVRDRVREQQPVR